MRVPEETQRAAVLDISRLAKQVPAGDGPREMSRISPRGSIDGEAVTLDGDSRERATAAPHSRTILEIQ